MKILEITVVEIENSLNGLNSSLEVIGVQICEFEDISGNSSGLSLTDGKMRGWCPRLELCRSGQYSREGMA